MSDRHYEPVTIWILRGRPIIDNSYPEYATGLILTGQLYSINRLSSKFCQRIWRARSSTVSSQYSWIRMWFVPCSYFGEEGNRGRGTECNYFLVRVSSGLRWETLVTIGGIMVMEICFSILSGVWYRSSSLLHTTFVVQASRLTSFTQLSKLYGLLYCRRERSVVPSNIFYLVFCLPLIYWSFEGWDPVLVLLCSVNCVVIGYNFGCCYCVTWLPTINNRVLRDRRATDLFLHIAHNS